MILVDTTVWIDHLRRGEPRLVALLEAGSVLMHPFVRGELACGHLRNRGEVLRLLSNLPRSIVATDDEVMYFIDRFRLSGSGIGFVDAHLMASVSLSPPARLWTRDKRLHTVATSLLLSWADG